MVKYKFHEERNEWVETEFISMWDFNKLPALQTGEDGLFLQHYLKLQVKEHAQSYFTNFITSHNSSKIQSVNFENQKEKPHPVILSVTF